MSIAELKAWLYAFLHDLLDSIAPQVAATYDAYFHSTQSPVAVETSQHKIQQLAQGAVDRLDSPTYGLDALNNRLENLNTQIQAAYDGIILAMGIPAQEPTPPVWYTPPPDPTPPEDVADAVWAYGPGLQAINGDTTPLTMETVMRDMWSLASFTAGHNGVPNPLNPYFSIVVWEPWKLGDNQFNWPEFNMAFTPDLIDWTLVEATDTPYTFLARTQPLFGWLNIGPIDLGNDEVAWCQVGGTGITTLWVRSNFTTLDMLQLAQLVPTPPTPEGAPIVAPVWPGVAGATLGAPVALADGLILDGPLDGVLVHITGHPPGAGKYGFGDLDSWRYLGAVLFISDNGQAEWPTQIGPESGLITPRSMKRAASAVIRLGTGFSGTATPWTITI
jgi:hypothetical protein